MQMIDRYSIASTFLLPCVRFGHEGGSVVFYREKNAEEVARRAFGLALFNAIA